ncbi:MAG: hypothetical protein ACLQVY_18150 [Limisphaerales bacterium]
MKEDQMNRSNWNPIPSPQAAKKTIAKKPKNWLSVNIGEDEAKGLRALAECAGIEFRTFLEMGVRHFGFELEKELKKKRWDAAKMSRARRKAMGRNYRQLVQSIQWRPGDNYKN